MTYKDIFFDKNKSKNYEIKRSNMKRQKHDIKSLNYEIVINMKCQKYDKVKTMTVLSNIKS